jgi:hypothetical protein
MLEQTLLDGQTAGITMQAAVLSQDTVTGNDNGDGITPIGAAHLVCQFLVLHNGAFATPLCRFKQLSIRHLRLHGLDSRFYWVKYGIPYFQPLASWKTIARRRQVVRQTRPWEKAPTYRKEQA